MRLVTRVILAAMLLALGSCTKGGSEGDSGPCADLNLKLFGGDQCGSGPSAMVKIAETTKSNKAFVCTGTLVTSDDVLTAGHCVEDAKSIVVKIGDKTYRAKRWAAHPQYRHEYVEELGTTIPRADVAMITLEKSAGIAPIPLLLSRNIREGEQYAIYGYGDTGDGKDTLDVKAGYSKISGIDGEMFFSNAKEGDADTCQGDSGGAATEKVNGATAVIGVTSWGTAECTLEGISVYTNVQNSAILNFITAYAPDVAVK